jgi:hypothetical protein
MTDLSDEPIWSLIAGSAQPESLNKRQTGLDLKVNRAPSGQELGFVFKL